MADWADGSDLASMSRGGNVLQQLGYDPDEVRANPGLRAEVMAKLAGPYAAAPVQMAQNTPPPPIPTPNPRSQNGNSIDAPAGQPRLFNRAQPAAPPQPVPSTLGSATIDASTPQTSASVSPSGTAGPSNVVDIANARDAAGKLLAPEPAQPDTSAEDSMISAKSVPLNPNASIYKEGTAGKVGRGFKAAAVGFMRDGAQGAVAGAADPASVGATPYGAPDKDYQIDDATRQSQLALAEKQKADALAKYKTMTDLRKQQDTRSKDAGDIANNTAKLPNETKTADADMMRAQDAGNPKNEMEAIAAYGRETDPAKKAAMWDTVTKMHNAAISEKPPKVPGEHPSEGLARYQDLHAAAVRENGGKPLSTDQLAKLSTDLSMTQHTGITGAVANKILDSKKSAMDKATALLRDGTDKAGQPYRQQDWQADMQAAQDQFEADIEAQGGTVQHMTIGDGGEWTAAPGKADASPSIPAPPKVGDVRKGYRYNGGELSDPASWSKVKPKGK